MSDQPERDWRLYLKDMVRFGDKVMQYAQGIDQRSFAVNDIVYDAILRNLELIGEAASHVPPAARELHPAVAWRQIVATRNRLIHGYLGLDDELLWSIVQDDIPPMLRQLRAALEETDPIS